MQQHRVILVGSSPCNMYVVACSSGTSIIQLQRRSWTSLQPQRFTSLALSHTLTVKSLRNCAAICRRLVRAVTFPKSIFTNSSACAVVHHLSMSPSPRLVPRTLCPQILPIPSSYRLASLPVLYPRTPLFSTTFPLPLHFQFRCYSYPQGTLCCMMNTHSARLSLSPSYQHERPVSQPQYWARNGQYFVFVVSSHLFRLSRLRFLNSLV